MQLFLHSESKRDGREQVKTAIEWKVERLSPTQARIADYVEKNLQRLPYLTQQEIAKEVQTSTATVSRFWRVIGYANLRQFRNHCRELLIVSPASKMKAAFAKIASNDTVSEVANQAATFLDDTVRTVSRAQFRSAAVALASAPRSFVFAPGPAEGLGMLLQFRLNRFNIDIEMMNKHGVQLFESLLKLRRDDLLVVFAFFSLVPEIRVLLDHASEIGCTTVIITDRLVSELNKLSTILLYVCRGPVGEFHSMVATTALVESLTIETGQVMKDGAISSLERLQELKQRYAGRM